jgi:hypothetical protein
MLDHKVPFQHQPLLTLSEATLVARSKPNFLSSVNPFDRYRHAVAGLRTRSSQHLGSIWRREANLPAREVAASFARSPRAGFCHHHHHLWLVVSMDDFVNTGRADWEQRHGFVLRFAWRPLSQFVER